MTEILIELGMVVGIFAGISVLLTLLILLVLKVCKVETDKKAEEVLERLAGANCGGCGCSGCSDFAQKLCHGQANINDCNVTDKDQKKAIAQILGVAVEDSEPTVMVACCVGGNNAKDKFAYVGDDTCSAQQMLGGCKVCPAGCLGEGSCAKVCPQGAITMKDGHSYVDTDLCTSCGSCQKECPRKILKRIPVSAKIYVGCVSECKGKDVMGACTKGCIGCGLCAKNCPQGAITMENNLPVIDYKKCTGCLTCVGKCPRKIILVRE